MRENWNAEKEIEIAKDLPADSAIRSAIKLEIESAKEAMTDLWIDLSRDGAACDFAAMEDTALRIKTLFEEEDFCCRLDNAGAEVPPVLVGFRKGSTEEKPILFTGHYDTVFKKGEWVEPAYRTEDGLLRGPGVLDMKGGIIAALFTARVLRRLGKTDCPLKIIFAGDEEVGHEKGGAEEVLIRESTGGFWAFNMETGFENQDVCIGRKGTASCIVEITGTASHPGNAFEKGRNAIVEMAHKILGLSGLTDLARGITVSVGKIAGGTAGNVIAERCTAEFDLRFSSMEDYGELKKRIQQVCSHTYIDGTKTEVSYAELLPPYETTEKVMELFRCVKQAANELGREEIGGRVRGGASDAAYVGQSGTPVLCSMGVRGGESHSRKEYAVIESLCERTELLTYMILNKDRLVGEAGEAE